MKQAIALLSLILCLLLSALPGRSLSQGRAPQPPAELQQRLEQMQRQLQQQQEEFQRQTRERQEAFQRQTRERQSKNEAMQKIREEYSDEAYQEALGVTAEQWRAIQPKLARIKRLRDMPYLDISIYVYAGGASGSYRIGGFTETSDGGRSTANASGGFSATRGVNSTSDSTTRSGTAGGYGRSFAEGGANVRVQTPGPVRKQVGDLNLGWQWQRASRNQGPDGLTEGDWACEQLLEAMEAKDANSEQIRQRLADLRRLRELQQTELREAQRQLRALITPEQEPKLVLMGYLD